jgi:hypothetical protein
MKKENDMHVNSLHGIHWILMGEGKDSRLP